VVVVVVVGGGHGGGGQNHHQNHGQHLGETETEWVTPPERTEAFDDSAGIATTIRALTVNAHNTVRVHLTNLRAAPDST
jgi:hypothetical protein